MEHPTKPFAEQSDVELIRAARREPAAFEALFERHAPALRQWLFTQTGNAAVSHDLPERPLLPLACASPPQHTGGGVPSALAESAGSHAHTAQA